MRKIITKISLFFLAILVLFSSISFTVEKHLCGGHIFSESFFGKAEKCGMDDGSCTIENNNHSFSKKSCCKDEIQIINGSLFEKEAVLKIDKNQEQLLTIFNLIDTDLFCLKENGSTQFENYFPPPNTQDFTVLYQVFRI